MILINNIVSYIEMVIKNRCKYHVKITRRKIEPFENFKIKTMLNGCKYFNKIFICNNYFISFNQL